MHLSRTPALAAVAASLVVLSAAAATASPADAPGQGKDGHYSFAVIGDVPYGDAQVAAFPRWVDQINATPDLSFTIHVGDIKNGSSIQPSKGQSSRPSTHREAKVCDRLWPLEVRGSTNTGLSTVQGWFGGCSGLGCVKVRR